jgi:hypothetical protein
MAKRETNTQRAAREDEHRTTQLIASALAAIIGCRGFSQPGRGEYIAELIHRAKLFKGRVCVATYPKPESKNTVIVSLVHASTVPADTRHLLVKKPESERLRETYAVIGRELCEFKGNVADFLRLVADKIEGKQSYSPGEDWYDRQIETAYLEVLCRSSIKHMDAVSRNAHVPPSFSEFWDIFQKQNPKAKLVSEDVDLEARRSLKRRGHKCYTERSLRRSLKRLGCTACHVKPGPKEKTPAKIEDDEFEVRYVSNESLSQLLRGPWRLVQSSRRQERGRPKEK